MLLSSSSGTESGCRSRRFSDRTRDEASPQWKLLLSGRTERFERSRHGIHLDGAASNWGHRQAAPPAASRGLGKRSALASQSSTRVFARCPRTTLGSDILIKQQPYPHAEQVGA